MQPTQPITLRTSRLLLRQWQDVDYAPFARINADPQVMQFMLGCLDEKASNASADKFRQLIEEHGWGMWAVEHQATATFIGFVGLYQTRAAVPCLPCVEIGWRLASEHWGKGYATEAARAVLHFGFTTLQLPEIVAFTAVINQRSQAVMERLGMQRDCHTFQHPSVPVGHSLREHCLYRLATMSSTGNPYNLPQDHPNQSGKTY